MTDCKRCLNGHFTGFASWRRVICWVPIRSRNNLLTKVQERELLELRQQQKTSDWKLLLEHNWVPESTIFELLKQETPLEAIPLPKLQVDPQVTTLISGKFSERQLVLPLKMMGKRQLLLAVADPTDEELIEAIRQNASDIHIQPRGEDVIVRYRIDGVLTDKIRIPRELHPSLVSRLKAIAEMDIADRRRPQDGRITINTAGKTLDMRISASGPISSAPPCPG